MANDDYKFLQDGGNLAHYYTLEPPPQTLYAPTLKDVIAYGYDIGLKEYPLYKGSEQMTNERDINVEFGQKTRREWLNDAIVKHFYLREIGAETPAQFVFYLNRKMCENMSSVNRAWEALDMETEQLMMASWSNSNSASDSVNDATNNAQTGSTTDSTANTKAQSYASRNPQTSMNGKNPPDYYESGTFSNSDSTSHGTSSGTTDSTGHQTGKLTGEAHVQQFGNRIRSVENYYTGLNNVKLMVFAFLEPCFRQLWS